MDLTLRLLIVFVDLLQVNEYSWLGSRNANVLVLRAVAPDPSKCVIMHIYSKSCVTSLDSEKY